MYADARWRMLTHADARWRMLTGQPPWRLTSLQASSRLALLTALLTALLGDGGVVSGGGGVAELQNERLTCFFFVYVLLYLRLYVRLYVRLYKATTAW